MKSTKGLRAALLGVVSGLTLLVVFASPMLAFADDDSSSGIDILIPKLSEFIPALIAFLIIWFVLAKFVWPSVLDTLDKRQEKIQTGIDEAENAQAHADEVAKQCDQELLEARVEAEKIIADARKQAEAERTEVLNRAQREASEIIAKGRDAIEDERHQAMVELSSSVVDLSVEIATKIIGDDLTQEQQRDLAEKYLEEVSISDER